MNANIYKHEFQARLKSVLIWSTVYLGPDPFLSLHLHGIF